MDTPISMVSEKPSRIGPPKRNSIRITISLMSVIGYSLNDSIVVSDRIRENFRKIRRGTPYDGYTDQHGQREAFQNRAAEEEQHQDHHQGGTGGDLTIVASLMSVIGYSLNDSIVVSDRIRENFRKIRQHGQREAFQNRAAEEEQHQDHHQGGTGGDQGTVQRLGQRPSRLT
jgi:hypothetical protein